MPNFCRDLLRGQSHFLTLAMVVFAATAALAACGNSPTGTDTTTAPTAPAATAAAAATTTTGATTTTVARSVTTRGPTTTTSGAQVAVIPAADRSPAGTLDKAPSVIVPAGPPPPHLEIADLIVGHGRQAKWGVTITVRYELATYSARRTVQSSFSSPAFHFILGVGEVIPGWDKGLVGMRVGGRRELIVPPALGYGDKSPGPGVAANDTLVYIVDLVKIP